MALPRGFVDLVTAHNSKPDTLANIIGVVVDRMEPKVLQNGQHMFTFKLLDRLLQDSYYGNEGLTVRFFKGDPQSLPPVRQVGDVVLLRNIKMMSLSSQPVATSNFQTEVTVFPGNSIPSPSFEIAFQGKQRLECLGIPFDVRKFSLEEQTYVIQLKHEINALPPPNRTNGVSNPNNSLPPGTPTGPATMRKRPGQNLDTSEPKRSKYGAKFRLIKDTRHLTWADLCVQVVKKFPTNFGGCELYATDYTENKDMFDYAAPEEEDRERERDGDAFGYTEAPKKAWPGPYGQFVLKVNVKDPHARFANREVAEGDFVLLRNVKMKFNNHLEGDMWPDDLDREKVKIQKLVYNDDNAEIHAVLERKDKYWRSREAKLAAKQQREMPKVSKTEKKRQKKQEKEERAARARAGKKNKDGQNEILESVSKGDINPYIRCSHEDVPISTIREVIDPTDDMHTTTTPAGMSYAMPFMNAKYRVRVRVVDFSPKPLEDFAVVELPAADNDDKSESSPIMDWEPSEKHEWCFSLLLEDASKPKGSDATENRLWANVSHQDAQFLFGNGIDDPSDLRNDRQLLCRLREKLCILWGNLEEKTEDTLLSNLAFECCLDEYGVEMDEDDPEKPASAFGFKRMYRMFGVTIL